jgi:hypothetical protein
VSATAEQIARLRRMVNEPTITTYTDAILAASIERYPCMDERGQMPYSWTSATPPVRDPNESWMETYDLAAAAAEIWSEKAGVLAQDFDTSADGASLSRSQAYEQAMKQSRYYGSRRRASTITLYPSPRMVNDTVEINA